MTTRAKPARSLSYRLLAGQRLLTLTVGKLTTTYSLTPLATDYGRGFRLVKLPGERGSDATEEEYAVNIDGQEDSCTCKGHTYKDRCKHSAAVRTLIARQLL